MTLELFEPIKALDPAFGGNGCGLSVAFEPGALTDPGFASFPETMMIDLSSPDCFFPLGGCLAVTALVVLGRFRPDDVRVASGSEPTDPSKIMEFTHGTNATLSHWGGRRSTMKWTLVAAGIYTVILLTMAERQASAGIELLTKSIIRGDDYTLLKRASLQSP